MAKAASIAFVATRLAPMRCCRGLGCDGEVGAELDGACSASWAAGAIIGPDPRASGGAVAGLTAAYPEFLWHGAEAYGFRPVGVDLRPHRQGDRGGIRHRLRQGARLASAVAPALDAADADPACGGTNSQWPAWSS